MALNCICQYFQSYLKRMAYTGRIDNVNAFLGKHWKVIASHLRKGSFHQQEQHVSPSVQILVISYCSPSAFPAEDD